MISSAFSNNSHDMREKSFRDNETVRHLSSDIQILVKIALRHKNYSHQLVLLLNNHYFQLNSLQRRLNESMISRSESSPIFNTIKLKDHYDV